MLQMRLVGSISIRNDASSGHKHYIWTGDRAYRQPQDYSEGEKDVVFVIVFGLPLVKQPKPTP
jgi:hypothetical protein